MALRLLVDEDSQAHRLVKLLRQAGHDVLTANEAGLQGEDDVMVWQRARLENRALLTRNPVDFLSFHLESPDHAGVLAVYQDSDPSKNMSRNAIVKAVSNVETSGSQVSGQFLPLNHHRW